MEKKEFDEFIQKSKRFKSIPQLHIRVQREGKVRKFFLIKQEAILIDEHKRENAYTKKEIDNIIRKAKEML